MQTLDQKSKRLDINTSDTNLHIAQPVSNKLCKSPELFLICGLGPGRNCVSCQRTILAPADPSSYFSTHITITFPSFNIFPLSRGHLGL